MAEFILKDWYGKEKSFDHETIYVRDAEGNLMPFTQGDGNPTLAPLEVAENGTYTAPDGVDGYSPVTVNVPTPEIVLQDKTITENGTYTADSGYDGLGSVLVDIASSGGSTVKFYKGRHNITWALNKRIEINFGFTPDFLMIYPAATMTAKGVLMFACGVSKNFASVIGQNGTFLDNVGGSSSTAGGVYTSNGGEAIDNTSGAYIHSVDSTGFKFGDNYHYASGLYTVLAIGL